MFNGGKIGRSIPIFIFIVVSCGLFFGYAWQNVRVALLKAEIERLKERRDWLEKQVKMETLEVATLKAYPRIEWIAREKLNLVPITEEDIVFIALPDHEKVLHAGRGGIASGRGWRGLPLIRWFFTEDRSGGSASGSERP